MIIYCYLKDIMIAARNNDSTSDNFNEVPEYLAPEIVMNLSHGFAVD